MAEVTNDLLYEVLRSMQHDLGSVKADIRDVKGELQAMRTHMTGLGQDISNIYNILGRHDDRLARIETRLGLLEPAH
jgi:hypothetical protein